MMREEIRFEVAGFTITGRKKAASRDLDRDHPPLIVAIHGGGFQRQHRPW